MLQIIETKTKLYLITEYAAKGEIFDHIVKNKKLNDFEQQYQDSFEKRHQQMVWEHEKVSSWYQNSSGKVVTTSPWKLLEYWNWTKKFNSDDYEF